MSRRKPMHKDWRTWTVVIVMLAAIGAYVLTLDDQPIAVAPAPAAP